MLVFFFYSFLSNRLKLNSLHCIKRDGSMVDRGWAKLAAARNLTQPPQAASPSRTCSIGWVRSISVPSFRSYSSASFDRFESVESNGGAERSLPKPRWLCAACVGHHAPPLVTTSLKWTEASFDSLRFPAQPTRPALRMEFKEF